MRTRSTTGRMRWWRGGGGGGGGPPVHGAEFVRHEKRARVECDRSTTTAVDFSDRGAESVCRGAESPGGDVRSLENLRDYDIWQRTAGECDGLGRSQSGCEHEQ